MDAFNETRLPCLFDRLIDHQPDLKDEGRQLRQIPVSDYRLAVLRDLRWLLNAPRHRDEADIYRYPEVKKSVLNYGTRDLTGKTAEGLQNIDLEEELRQVILTYEPRILPDTLTVKALDSASMPGRIAFEINGHIWALPHPERLFLRTEMDLETGTTELRS